MNAPETNLRDFIENEIASNERGVKRTYIIGLSVAVIVFAYLFWVANEFSSVVLNPRNLAMTVVAEIDRDVPAFLKDTEHQLASDAPEIAKGVFKSLTDLLPMIQEAGIKQIDVLYGLVPVLNKESEGVVEHFYSVHGDSIRAYFEAHNEELFVEEFVDELLNGLEREIDKDFQTIYKGEHLKGVHEISLAHLHDINRSILKMTRMRARRMDRIDRLRRRMIVAWINALGPLLEVQTFKSEE